MDTINNFDPSTLFPTNLNVISSGGGVGISTTIAGQNVGYSNFGGITSVTSAPSGATSGIPQPIYSSFTDWLHNGNPQGAFLVGIPGWMLLGLGIVAYVVFFKKKRV